MDIELSLEYVAMLFSFLNFNGWFYEKIIPPPSSMPDQYLP
jgi:hypothetical protein